MVKKAACLVLAVLFVFAQGSLIITPAFAEGDNASPLLVSSNPAEGVSGLNFTNQAIVLTFDEPILAKSELGYYVAEGTSRYDIRVWVDTAVNDVDFSIVGNVMTLTKNYSNGWGTSSNGEQISVRIAAGGIEDLNGNLTTSDITVNFTVQDTHPPYFTGSEPTSSTSSTVAFDVGVQAFYTDYLAEGPTWDDITAIQDPDTAPINIPLHKIIDGKTIKITPNNDDGIWGDGGSHIFKISVPARAVQDRSAQPVAQSNVIYFRTVDGKAPSLTGTSPGAATHLQNTGKITLTFDENIKIYYGSANHDNGDLAGSESDPIIVTVDGQRQAIHFTANPAYGICDRLEITPTSGKWCAKNDGAAVNVAIAVGVIKDWNNNKTQQPIRCDFTIADDCPPAITSVTPPDGATGVATDTAVSITFGEPVLKGDAWDSITVKASGNPVGIVKDITGGNTLVISPASGSWDDQDGYLYTVSIPADAIVDRAGNTQAFSSAFRTQDIHDPQVVSATPAANAADILANTAIQLTLTEEVRAEIGQALLSSGDLPGAEGDAIRVAVKGAYVPVHFAVAGSALTITPKTGAWAAEPNGQNIALTIDGGTLRDLSGNPIASSYSLTFHLLDNTIPSIASSSPATGAIGVAGNAAVIITYSENISGGSAYAAITVTDQANRIIPITKQIDDDTLTIKPASGIWDDQCGYTYTVHLPAGAVKDITGAEAAPSALSFTTVDNKPPKVVSTDPTDGADAIPVEHNTINFTFDEAVTVKDATAIKVYRCDGDETADYTVSVNGSTLSLKYNYSYIASCSSYRIELGAGAVQDGSGHANTSLITLSFASYDEYEPYPVGNSPANNARNVAPTMPATYIFSTNIRLSAAYGATITVTDENKKPVQFTKAIDGMKLIIRPTAGSWGYSKIITVKIPACSVENTSGIGTSYGYQITFYTIDKAAPVPVQYSPAVNATKVSAATGVFIKFNEPLIASVNWSKVTATCNGAKFTKFIKAISGNTLSFKSSVGWAYGKTYVITVPAGALKDGSGNVTTKPSVLKFTIMQKPVSLTITKVYPSAKVLNGTAMKVYYKIDKKCNLRLDIINSDGVVARTITKANAAAGTGYIAWDGKAVGGRKMLYDACTIKLTATPVSLATASASVKTAACKLMAKPVVDIFNSPAEWSRRDEHFYMDFTINTSCSITVGFYKGSMLISSSKGSYTVGFEGDEEDLTYSWSGYLANGNLLPTGSYKVIVTINNGVGSSSDTCYVIVN